MSSKKKINSKKGKTLIMETIAGFIIIILILLWLLCSKLTGGGKTVYKIEPRGSNISSVKLSDDSGFDTIGWLRVQGTSIDYPIIQAVDDVEKDFPVELESFVWSLNYDNKYHNRIRVSGHNIFNLSSHPELHSDLFTRFEELMDFVYYDFAKENQHIQLTMDGKDYIYKIFMVGFVPSTDKSMFPIGDDYSSKDMKTYLDIFKKYNFYDYDIDVSNDDYIITLSTCTRFYGINKDVELYVLGRRLRDGEEATSYSVSTTDVYKEIENILKGDENDEENDM